MIRRYFWAVYWAQSEEKAAADRVGSAKREEAVEKGRREELSLIRTWGPGKGFRLRIEERETHAG